MWLFPLGWICKSFVPFSSPPKTALGPSDVRWHPRHIISKPKWIRLTSKIKCFKSLILSRGLRFESYKGWYSPWILSLWLEKIEVQFFNLFIQSWIFRQSAVNDSESNSAPAWNLKLCNKDHLISPNVTPYSQAFQMKYLSDYFPAAVGERFIINAPSRPPPSATWQFGRCCAWILCVPTWLISCSYQSILQMAQWSPWKFSACCPGRCSRHAHGTNLSTTKITVALQWEKNTICMRFWNHNKSHFALQLDQTQLA